MSLRTLELDTSWGRLTVAGGSRAGEATLLVVPQLRLAIDPGRPHRSLPPMSTVFVSHGHLDHIGGLGYWASQRFLNTMGPGRVLLPEAIAPQVEELLELLARLEGGRPYQVELVAVADSSSTPLRRDLDMVSFRTDHWVPTLGVELSWKRRRLRPDLRGRPPEEIAKRRLAGERVSVEERVPLLAYCADTGPRLFRWRPSVLQAEILIIECSFFRAGDRQRAEQYGHLHLQDLLAITDRLQCRHLVLLHPSRRSRLRDIDEMLASQLIPKLTCKVHTLMVDWD